MNILGKYAILRYDNFDIVEKNITLSEKTVVKIISCGFCGTDKHTLEEVKANGISLGHEILGQIVHLGNNHKVVGGEEIVVGDRVIVVPGKNCRECTHCQSHSAQGNLCQHRTAHGWGTFSDKYFVAGGFSSHIEIMDDAWLVKVPENVPDDIAVLAEPLAIAVRAVDRALSGTRPDRDLGAAVAMRAGVMGLGPIGYLVAYVLNTLGADVVGFDISKWRCDYFTKNLGFSSICINEYEPEKIDKEIVEKSPIKDFDVVFECAGTTSAFISSLISVRKAGRVIELGNYIQKETAAIDPSWICRKELDVIGFVLANPFTYLKVMKLLTQHSIDALRIVTRKIKLSNINELWPLSHNHELKVIVQNDL